jgi:hypothetical protein
MQTVVQRLKYLLDQRAELKDAVTYSLLQANEPGMSCLEDLYQYLNKVLTHIPTEEALMPSVWKF